MFGFGKKVKKSALAEVIATKTKNNITEYYPNILITIKKQTDVSIDFVNDNLMKKHLMYCLIATQTLMMFNEFKVSLRQHSSN